MVRVVVTLRSRIPLKQRMALTRPTMKNIVLPATPRYPQPRGFGQSTASLRPQTAERNQFKQVGVPQQHSSGTHITIMPRSSSEIVIGFSCRPDNPRSCIPATRRWSVSSYELGRESVNPEMASCHSVGDFGGNMCGSNRSSPCPRPSRSRAKYCVPGRKHVGPSSGPTFPG